MGQRDLDSTESLLQELLWTYGPCGQEDAVRTVCARELQPLVDDMWTDDAGNLIGYIGADDDASTSESRDHRHRTSSIAGGSATRVMAHMDELSMLVKRVEPDGTLHMTQLGVMYPGNFGLGPVALLGDHQTLTAVLTLGSEHTTQESPRIWETKPDQGDRALDWQHVYVFTGRTPEDLAAAGRARRHSGVRRPQQARSRRVRRLRRRLLPGRSRRGDRAAAGGAPAARAMGNDPPGTRISSSPPTRRSAGSAAPMPARTLPGTLTIALDVGPTEREYATTVTGGPIVGYSDALCVYDKDVADRLMADRYRSRVVAAARDAGGVHVRCVALQGQWADAARGAAVPADAEHPRLRSHPARRDR